MRLKHLTINSSGLQAFRKCPFYFEQYYIRGKRGSEPPLAAELGSRIHEGLEMFYKGEEITSVGDPKADAIVAKYISNFPLNEDHFEVIAVEENFNVAVTEWLSVAGSIDLIAQDKETGEILLIDHKTTSGTSYLRNKVNSSQFTCYMWALNQLGYECNNGIINGIATSPRSHEDFIRINFYRTEYQKNLWKDMMLSDCRRIKEMIESNILFAKVLDGVCYEYRQECFLLSCCTAESKELAEAELNVLQSSSWKNFSIELED